MEVTEVGGGGRGEEGRMPHARKGGDQASEQGKEQGGDKAGDRIGIGMQ